MFMIGASRCTRAQRTWCWIEVHNRSLICSLRLGQGQRKSLRRKRDRCTRQVGGWVGWRASQHCTTKQLRINRALEAPAGACTETESRGCWNERRIALPLGAGVGGEQPNVNVKRAILRDQCTHNFFLWETTPIQTVMAARTHVLGVRP